MKKMMKAIRGSPQKKPTEEEMSMEALLTRRVSSGCAKGDRVAALGGSSTSPLGRSWNSQDPAMGGVAACGRPTGMPASRSFDPVIARGMVKSGSFDLSKLPSVSLPFLHYEDDDMSSSPPPPFPANARINGTPTNHQNKTPPMSPVRKAAIEKCMAAIEEVKAALAESSTEDGSMESGSPLAARSPLAGSPRVGSTPLPGSPRAGSPQDGGPRAASAPLAGSPRVYRNTPFNRWGSDPAGVIRSADPAEPYSEEAVWAWLDGKTDEPPAYRTLPSPPAAPRDTFGKTARAGDAVARLGRPEALRNTSSGEGGRAQGQLAGGSQVGGSQAGGAQEGGPRVYRTPPYIKRGVGTIE
ncbi:hypothetical protein T484DRAFT_3630639 [Baffinella frigidus]|nr:hypothetical protein T484DRAFT_3630639 [Cryptophyta sp. CCMP2293]